jgi:hypothetical protein
MPAATRPTMQQLPAWRRVHQPTVGIVQILPVPHFSCPYIKKAFQKNKPSVGCQNGRSSWTGPAFSPQILPRFQSHKSRGRLVTDVRVNGKGISEEKEREPTFGQGEG